MLDDTPKFYSSQTTKTAPIKIKELEKLAKERDLQAVVTLTVSRDGTVSVVTYGEDKQKCRAIGYWGQGLFNHAVSVVPFRTVFGWGNFGKPQPLSDTEQQTVLKTITMGVLKKLNGEK